MTEISHIRVTVLVVGAEGTGKHDVSKCLVEMATSMEVDVHTCSCLPLPADSELFERSIDFVCFMVHLSSKDSMRVVTDSVAQLDIQYFLGRCVIIANTKGETANEVTGDSVMPVDVKNLATQLGIPVLFRDTEDDKDRIDLGRKLMQQIEAAVGQRFAASPLLQEAVSV